MTHVYRLWTHYCPSEHGQTMAEYGLIIALIAVVAITAWASLGTSIKTTINGIAGCI